MKKLFISCPMRNRTEEAIRESMDKMHKIAEATLGEEVEVIQSYIQDNPPKNSKQAVWYLGESIKKLSEADVVICIDEDWDYEGCRAERSIARSYGIPVIDASTEFVAPDVIDAMRGERAICEPNK